MAFVFFLLLIVPLHHVAVVLANPYNSIMQRERFPDDGSPTEQKRQPPQQRFLTNNDYNPDQEDTLSVLKRKLLEDYDHEIYPFEYAWDENSASSGDNHNGTKREGLHIETSFNFHRVVQVDVTKSMVDMVVWFRLRWIDPRLQWDPANFDNIDTLHISKSRIWIPDMELWNQQTSVEVSLTETLLNLHPDGTVIWSRPGHLKPICKFSGLEDFPFDSLGCTIEIGSWAYSGLYIRPVLWDDMGFTVGGSETAGPAFSEFDLTNISAEEHVYPPYPTVPDEDWPVIFYHFVFTRAWEPYLGGYIVLQIVFNVCAFACFWLPPQCGERLSLNITAMLAAVTSDLTVSVRLPSASENTWVRTFAGGSLFFATAALLQSAIVVYFYYQTGDDLIPPYWKKWMKNCKTKKKKEQEKEEENGDVTAKRARMKSIIMHMDDSSGVGEGNDDNPHNTALFGSISKDNDDESDDDTGSENNNSAPIQLKSMKSVAFQDDMPEQSPTVEKDKHINLQSRKQKMLVLQDKFSSTTKGDDFFGKDANDFKNESEQANNARWQNVATNVDQISRILFPATYAIFLAERALILNN